MRTALDKMVLTVGEGLGVATLILAINKPEELNRPELVYPLMFSTIVLGTYLIGRDFYETLRDLKLPKR